MSESVEALNLRLIDHYGLDTNTGRPIFRIVWANDELEKRLVATLDSGIQLLYPTVREVKKYPYLKDLYVLERLVVVPEVNRDDLPVSKLSYEPLWAYRDVEGHSLPPIWEATKLIVDVLYAALGKKSMAKYVDSEENTTVEGRDQRIAKITEELFGNETETGDAIAYGEAIIVPQTYRKDN